MKNRVLQRSFFLFCLQSLFVIVASAQICDSLSKCDYTMEEINLRTPWAISDNTAGLVYNDLLNYFTIGAIYNSETGDYRNYNTPESMWNMGAYTQAYKKINKVYFYGDFKYQYDTKLDQTWLGTVLPNFTVNPILDSIPGKVLQESYIMTGKIAYKMSEKIALGIGLNYNTSTMAKRKDGRNSNTFSALDVKPGVSFKFGNFTTGINLIYQYWTDKVKYEFIGDESGKNLYYMEGLFFMTKSGITNTTIVDRVYYMQSYGGAIQLDYRKDNFEFFNQFKIGSGYLNNYEDGALTKRYSREDLLNYQYNTALKFMGNRINHFIQLGIKKNDRASYAILNNYELIPEEIRSWQYYEKDKVLRYMDLRKDLDASYRFCFKDTDWKYNFTLTAGFNKFWSDKTYKIYPYTYSQDFSVNTFYLKGAKFFYSGQKHIIELNAGFSASNGSASDKMLNATGTGNLGLLKLNTSLLTQDFNYHNVARKSYNIGGRYRHVLNPDKGNSYDISLNYMLVNTENKLNRNYLSIATSYNF
ncbi:MAG: DUF6850 family outer membrane beta-barrel protein [Petrimonas sp.]|jgi:hypothetical protein